jgi:hypothetical protein
MVSTLLLERAHTNLSTRVDVEHALQLYANELGVSLDHVITGCLQMVAEDYMKATGDGAIPVLG